MAQVVGHLPSKYEALSSNSSSTKKKKRFKTHKPEEGKCVQFHHIKSEIHQTSSKISDELR
jgi:hypothetical protein